jgi:hypothetical protein
VLSIAHGVTSRAVVISAMAGEHIHLRTADGLWHVQVEQIGPVYVLMPRAHEGVCGMTPSLVIYDEPWPPEG